MKTMQVQTNSSNELQIEVYNAHGEPQEIGFSENTPDLSNLSAGAYTICFRQGDDTYTEGFTKE
jgi:hypothetical protein